MKQLKKALFASIFIITSCTNINKPSAVQPPNSTITPKQTQTIAPALSATALSSWELSGAIAVKNSKKSWTASLNWLQQSSNNYQIRLFGPLGGGTVIIEKQGAIISYRDGSKKITSNNASQLLQKETGTQMPVPSLYYWVRGIAAPGAVSATQKDSQNRLISFNQAGFQVDYPAFTAVNSMNLPSKIRLQGHGVLIKLVIKQWVINAQSN